METGGRRTISKRLVFTQACLGFFANLAIALPYCRKIVGLSELDPKKRCIFVANHVSLLDTLLLGALFWRSGRYPILVLGDRKVWHASATKRALSRNIGFLLERGKHSPARLDELQAFGASARDFNLLVFPEGTRGNGVDIGECQSGIFHIAQEARFPIIPVFIENMQHVSTKTGRFHLLSGLRKVTVHFGPALQPDDYLPLAKDDFTSLIRRTISDLRPQSASEIAPAIRDADAQPALAPRRSGH